MMGFLQMIWDTLGLNAEQRVFLMRSAWVAFVSIHILWVCGWLTPVGVSSPFAHSDSLDTLTKLVMEDRIDRLQREILNTRASQCHAAPDSATRELHKEILDDLWAKYKKLALADPRVPRCDEL